MQHCRKYMYQSDIASASWTMLNYGLMRGKLRNFDRDNEFAD
jgi:hypothetical protein